MGMFDTIRVKRDGRDVEVQVKVYMGKYEPSLGVCEVGQFIPDPAFPKIKFAEWGYSDDGDCIVEFDKGMVTNVVFPPDTKGYKFPELPRPKHNPERKEKIWIERNYRMEEKMKGKSLEEVLLEPIQHLIDYTGFARVIFTKGNYIKISGKWQRIRPI